MKTLYAIITLALSVAGQDYDSESESTEDEPNYREQGWNTSSIDQCYDSYNKVFWTSDLEKQCPRYRDLFFPKQDFDLKNLTVMLEYCNIQDAVVCTVITGIIRISFGLCV